MHFWLAALPSRSFCARIFTAALVVLLLLATLCRGQAADPEPKRVLILHSFGRDFRPWADYARAIRVELDRQSPWTLNIQDHSLIIGRSIDDNPEAAFVEYLNALEAKRPPDLIICLGAPAANFVQRHRSDLFPGTPLLLTSVEQRRIDLKSLTEDDVVVPVAHDFPAIFENILRVLPDTKTVVVINGSSANEKFWLGELQRDARPFEGRVKFLWFENTPLKTIAKEAAAFPPNTAIFWHLMSVDAAGVAYEGDTALRRLYAVANAPIFTYDESYFGTEVVGGPMFSVVEGSRLAAEIAVRMLGGEKASEIRVLPLRYAAPKYDWRQLQRWNISESLLPAGSTILFREPTVWERYSWQISLITAVILAQAGLISALLLEHRRRRLAEVQSRERLTELARVVRFSTAGELTASIAHEINQPLGAILTNAETADAILKSQSPDIAQLADVAELKDIVDDILRDDRRASEVIRRMRSLLIKAPFELKSLDLNDLVRDTTELLTTLAVARKVELTTSITRDALPILGDRIQLQQVILNLVANGIDAMKETPRENRIISIRTSRVEEFAELSVSDRGPGIPGDKLKQIFEPFFTSKAGGMGMGLSIARTIIEAHQGLIWAKNREHGGASFRIKLPISNNGAGPS